MVTFPKSERNSLNNPQEQLVKGISNAELTLVLENLVENLIKKLNNFCSYICMPILFLEFRKPNNTIFVKFCPKIVLLG